MVFDANSPIPDFPGLAGRKIAMARADNLTMPPLRQIFDWWQARAALGQPTLDDFDIADFGPIAAHLYVAAAIEGGFELRLAGEEYIRLFGFKKGWVWHADATDPVIRDSAALLAFVARAKRPIRTIGRLELIERHWIELEALVCPLAPAHATQGGKFLGCVAALDASGATH
jgi:hypothetical protein